MPGGAGFWLHRPLARARELLKSRNRCAVAVLVTLHAVFASSAAAYQPLITDDTGTQGRGVNQIEFSYFGTADKEAGETTVTRSFPFVFTRGLTEPLDLYAGASYVRFRPPAAQTAGNGAGNPVAGLKWRFYDDKSEKLSLAVKPEILFPVSNRAEGRGLGSGRVNAGAALLLTQATGFGAVHANLAASTNKFELQANRESQRNALWRLSVAPVWELSETWEIALDVGLVTNPHKAERASMAYVELGVIYIVSKDLDFSLAVIRDVKHAGHSVTSGTVGCTWRFR
jgi:hypothetical protein